MGALEPPWYIYALMAYEERPYYVGLLKAAELQGATHQAVMEFQVVTDKQMPKIRAAAFERSAGQRLGFLLGASGHSEKANALHVRLAEGSPLPRVELEPPLAADPDLAPLVVECSARWHVICRSTPEPG